ncbi:alanine racemase [Roseateles sp.]|uniref:alanine racemase n=1 Tax=Roseateles sp. TaxID=1971397 RepID=UPI002E0319BC|nr:alanine racemase [Roseateles sp.]
MNGRTAVLTVDLDALASNWQALARLTAPARCAAVVKADAYGLGATPVVRRLLQAGCREFFVARVDEGIRLRDSLADVWPREARLYVLHGAPREAEQDCLTYGLVPVLGSRQQVDHWRALARRLGRALPAALQVDTAMSRQGLSPLILARLIDADDGLAGLATELVISDLVHARNPQHPANRRQLELVHRWRQRFPAARASLACSAGIFLGADFHLDLVRTGAAMYGATPTVGQRTPMRQVVQVQARLLHCQHISTGEPMGDRNTSRAQRPTRLATVALGPVGDYLCGPASHGRLRLQGRRMTWVGRPSTDTVTVDITDVDDERLTPGRLLEVLDEVQDINALAQLARTNAFEVLTSLCGRYRRQYRGSVPL